MVFSAYPLLENIVRYCGDAIPVGVCLVCLWAALSGRLSDVATRRLIAWMALAMLACIVARDLLGWRQSGWTIHFAIHCAEFVGVLVLVIRWQNKGNRGKTGTSAPDPESQSG